MLMPKQGDWDGSSSCHTGRQAQHALGPKRSQHLGVVAALMSHVGEAGCFQVFVAVAAAVFVAE